MTTQNLALMMGSNYFTGNSQSQTEPGWSFKDPWGSLGFSQTEASGVKVEGTEDRVAAEKDFGGSLAKYKITRWNLLGRTNGPQTVEFRQAAGSVDPHEIGEVMRFHAAMMRCAERLACTADSHLPDPDDDTPANLDSLFALLGLAKPTRQFWRRRFNKFAEQRFYNLEEPETMANFLKCLACHDTQQFKRIAARTRIELQCGWKQYLPNKGNQGHKPRYTRKEKSDAKKYARGKARGKQIKMFEKALADGAKAWGGGEFSVASSLVPDFKSTWDPADFSHEGVSW
jgi:hypothetical protein